MRTDSGVGGRSGAWGTILGVLLAVEGGEAGLYHLEVDEPRVTREGHPPGRTVLPLVVSPRG